MIWVWNLSQEPDLGREPDLGQESGLGQILDLDQELIRLEMDRIRIRNMGGSALGLDDFGAHLDA